MRRCGCYDSRLTNGYLTVLLIIKDPSVTMCWCTGLISLEWMGGLLRNKMHYRVLSFFPEYKKQRGKNKNSERRLYPPNVISGLSWLLTGSR